LLARPAAICRENGTQWKQPEAYHAERQTSQQFQRQIRRGLFALKVKLNGRDGEYCLVILRSAGNGDPRSTSDRPLAAPEIAARLRMPIIYVRPGLGRRGLFAAREQINNLNTFIDEFTIGGGIHRYIRFAIAAIT
jgi:hypothetical protein